MFFSAMSCPLEAMKFLSGVALAKSDLPRHSHAGSMTTAGRFPPCPPSLNFYPARPVKRLPNKMCNLFNRGAAGLTGVKYLSRLIPAQLNVKPI